MRMQITTTLTASGKIRMSEPQIADHYFIEQGEDGRFYITSNNGYFGYEGEGDTDLKAAITKVEKMIANYWDDRSEDAPADWKKSKRARINERKQFARL